MESLCLTAFGPFAEFEVNPSQAVAQRLGEPVDVLQVSFQGVDDWIAAKRERPPARLLMLGVAGNADRVRFECVARNRIGAQPDVLGVVQGPGPIDPTLPANLAANLWTVPRLLEETDLSAPSVDTGEYLCNYAFFRALAAFPCAQVGFLHLPPFDRMPLDAQIEFLRQVWTILNEPR